MVSLHFRGPHERSIFSIGFFALLALAGIRPTDAGELLEWSNNKGRTIDAELVSYDIISKKVQLRKRGGATGSVLLADLDKPSKFQALAKSPVAQVAYTQLQEKGVIGYTLATGWSGLLMAFWFALLALCCLFIILLPFKISLKILAKNDRDLVALLKLSGVSLLIEGAVLLATTASVFFSAQEEFGKSAYIFSIAATILYFIIATAILERHYVVSWLRAIGIQLLTFFIGVVTSPFLALTALIPIGITFGIIAFSIDSLLLKPLELI